MNQPGYLAGLIAMGLLLETGSGIAQNLVATSAPAQNWVALAASNDGARLAAAGSYGLLYVSTNSGTSWAESRTVTSGTEPQRPWTGLASSADGNRLIAVANFNPICVSTNAGRSWSWSGPTGVWAAVAASVDGMKAVAADHEAGLIYLSTDGGTTWQPSAAPNRRWRSVAVSADATRIVAGSDFGMSYNQLPSIYTSTNSGANWSLTSAPAFPWQAIACSADGTKLAAAAYGGSIYLSADAGATWSAANVPSLRWSAIACSADGTRLAADAWEGVVYVSSDSGHTWAKANAPAVSWQTIASSADGLRLVAGIWNLTSGGIYAADLPPALRIQSSSDGAVISWPAPASGYVLEQNSDVTAPSWQPVSTAPAIVDGQNQIRIHSGTSVCNYRLRWSGLNQR